MLRAQLSPGPISPAASNAAQGVLIQLLVVFSTGGRENPQREHILRHFSRYAPVIVTKASEAKEPYAECQECHRLFERNPRGPAPRYCSAACRQRAYQYRRRLRLRALERPVYGEEMRERRAIQRMIRQEMRDTVTEELVSRVRDEVLGDEELWAVIRREIGRSATELVDAILPPDEPGER
jgi:hypothetical protein